MLDYHVHLWPHDRLAEPAELSVERLGAYCELAARRGVVELAVTEHLFRFRRGREIVDGFWEREESPELKSHMASYFEHHATADLDTYVEVVTDAKAAGLPLICGLEVDYYPGRMDAVAEVLTGYPFDVLLGSVHWLGTFIFDELEAAVTEREWDRRGVKEVWRAYAEALEELTATRSCDVLAHPDLVKVSGRFPDKGFVTEVEDRIAAAAAGTLAAEINSAGLGKPVGELYPSTRLLRLFFEAGVPVTTASDTHGMSDVGRAVASMRDAALGAGYKSLRAFSGRRGREVAIGPPSVAGPGVAPDVAAPGVAPPGVAPPGVAPPGVAPDVAGPSVAPGAPRAEHR